MRTGEAPPPLGVQKRREEMRGSAFAAVRRRARGLGLVAAVAATTALPALVPDAASAHPRAHMMSGRAAHHLAVIRGHKVG